ncbi:hypothetical protein JKP88DRAFT_166628 [Tribonema minus]|uniref:MINDY deubiquitinase domain-containing protein n=1 Tax=Tribonema minus TaxID=303371 RepID=A0A836CCC1_9STRA|nr:hypothetical protein JKP88DRAFT_166628 [Tribonema minus]
MSIQGGNYRLKRIEFDGARRPVLCQNEGGPCPLLAILNVLLLRGSVQLHPDYSEVGLHQLVQLLAGHLLELSARHSEPAQAVNFQQQLHGVMELLPRLQYGLDVNVKFLDPQGFEFTKELSTFDLTEVTLFHGWLIDPQDAHMMEAVGSLSYNQLVEILVEYRAALHDLETDPHKAPLASVAERQERARVERLEQLLSRGAAIDHFLADTATQLTYHGLARLHAEVPEGSLCVFFRNNHFSTMHKHHGKLYLLVTDYGYANQPTAVWEKLDAIDGDTVLVNAFFEERNRPRSPPAPSEEGGADPDHLLALQLQQVGTDTRRCCNHVCA